MNRAEKVQHFHDIETKIALNHLNMRFRYHNSFYSWQRRFNASTFDHKACLLMAANQTGKTRTGCTVDAFHLLGDYPEDWEGHRFDFAPVCWLLGYSGEKTRDLLQRKLFGNLRDSEWEGGLIPADKIIDHISMGGTSRAMRTIRVRHASGDESVCQFWSYSQGQHALMGDIIDWYHIDEEPEDPEIYPQVLTRTLNGDQGRGGRGILTFTPENGKTDLVTQFMDEDNSDQRMTRATWDDCAHLSEDQKRDMLSKYPVYQRDMRSKGIPLMGAGLIYEIDENEVKCPPFEIPEHWEIINGMDFGYDHPQAFIQLAIDRDSGIFYVVKSWKKSKTYPHDAWEVVKQWGEDVPVAWPQDGLQTRENGKEKRDLYIEAGFNLLDDHATFEGGGVSVELGLMKINNLFHLGLLKIFSTEFEVFDEIRDYHKVAKPDGTSKIIKIKDDLLDAIRYAFMMNRYAVQVYQLSAEYDEEEYSFVHGDSATGY